MSNITTVFSVLSFIGFVLILIPLPWHLEAWNTGTCMYMIWTGIGLLVFFVDSVVWKDNVTNWAPVYCDIAARIILGLDVAIAASTLTINYRLYKIATTKTLITTKRDKRRMMMVDLAISLGFPLLFMALQYIVQGHRFDIYEEFGCFPSNVNSYPGIILYNGTPIAIALISGFFSIRSIFAFRRTQKEFKAIMTSQSGLNSNRFFRLMALAGIDVIFSVPLYLTFLIINVTQLTVDPWISWQDTHSDFSYVGQYPSLLWRNSPGAASFELGRWCIFVFGYIFFGFFGFSEEARIRYRRLAKSVAASVGYTRSTKIGTGNSNSSSGMTQYSTPSKANKSFQFGSSKTGSMPISIITLDVEKHDTPDLDHLDAISDLSSIKDIESGTGSSLSVVRTSDA